MASLMLGFANITNKAHVNRTRMTFGLVCRIMAILVGMISVFLIIQVVRVNLAWTLDMGPTQQFELRDLLCRIDRRCPSNLGEIPKKRD